MLITATAIIITTIGSGNGRRSSWEKRDGGRDPEPEVEQQEPEPEPAEEQHAAAVAGQPRWQK